ncbi:TetR/AcrR family transcriptional regulator [Aeromicrobium terrae]|uniref:TetR/AcrR family transcriptional regulator n=1 Tax=Aeromicrobium terrae TaxID=2498846 RepID=A0A5C8NH47_9ACTN|nr:TetR/AcrR family transcriptional regulator [Aeromicrobium terrae]TXL57466.1 TetR/AcrR family transcriptional regulator [Aeromicrobium terrae]
MNQKRTYTMGARAEAVQATRRRILEACMELSADRLISDISLDAVAATAGVSVQTVLRQFGSRSDLFEDAVTFANEVIAAERHLPEADDVDAAVRSVVDHYEKRGHTALMMLAQESSDAMVADWTERGKKMHRGWVQEAFAPQLAAAEDPELTTNLLVVATDVYTWKLLRRDRALSRARTEQQMGTLVAAVLAATTRKGA